jgi:hypothetical protein
MVNSEWGLGLVSNPHFHHKSSNGTENYRKKLMASNSKQTPQGKSKLRNRTPQKSEIQKISAEFMLAEYKNASEMRMAAIRRRESRTNFYFTLISVVTAFLAIIAQVFGVNDTFYYAIGILSFVIFVYGLMVFDRLVEGHISVRIYARGINRARRYFADFNPKIIPYLSQPINDDFPSFEKTGYLGRKGAQGGLLRLLIFSNTVVSTILVSIILATIIRWGTVYSIGFGIIAGLTTYILSIVYFNSQVKTANNKIGIRFPTK